MKLLPSGGFLNPKPAQKLGSEWNILKLHLNFWNPLNDQTGPTSFWWCYCDLVLKTSWKNFDNDANFCISSFKLPLKDFPSFKKNINKQNKMEKRKSGRKSSREKVLLQITLTGASLSEKKRFRWSEKKILYYPYYSREMEGEGPLFASLTEGTDAVLKERTQD